MPKDSVQLTVVGCLKGRVLKTLDERKTDVESGPYVGARSFHLASKKPVTDEIKRQQGHLVEVTGLVKRSALDDKGIKVGRVAIGGGSPVAGTRSMPSPADNVTVMDVSSVRMRRRRARRSRAHRLQRSAQARSSRCLEASRLEL